eukprot:CAMPEP_0182864796 /NCGR_PEP_ID=MMETSP0034_2-20130328/7351_1 /TAXON_ID=156128 /ORGANISM="Nephroselmis pyriformis, Strain CCMP717" /LENGTH=133 /DNA_ID=CAMNT_0024997059 /DNA_START=299 /DNA_END=700 /DNA_ORIENTATION=+
MAIIASLCALRFWGLLHITSATALRSMSASLVSSRMRRTWSLLEASPCTMLRNMHLPSPVTLRTRSLSIPSSSSVSSSSSSSSSSSLSSLTDASWNSEMGRRAAEKREDSEANGSGGAACLRPNVKVAATAEG